FAEGVSHRIFVRLINRCNESNVDSTIRKGCFYFPMLSNRLTPSNFKVDLPVGALFNSLNESVCVRGVGGIWRGSTGLIRERHWFEVGYNFANLFLRCAVLKAFS